jgi:hypothetical protein
MLLSKTRLNTISNVEPTKRGRSLGPRNYKHPAYITLTDFMRIQNEINPINAEYENRKAYEKKLKKLSIAKSKNWKDSLEMKKKNEFEMAKKRFLEDERRRRQLDEEEKKYQNMQNDIIIQKARRQLFEEQDAVKSFNSKLLFVDTLKERDYQKEIFNRKKQLNDMINQRFYENQKKKLDEYDKKMEMKKLLEEEKRKERMKIMKEQLQESKIKIIQDYQERLVEGRLMKLNMEKAVEEDKRMAELKEKQKKQIQKEYFEANERLKQEREAQKEKELAEEKKIELFAFKKQQRDDLRKKVEDQKIKDKLDMHQKMIDVQLNNLLKIQKEKEEAFNRAMEANSKAKEEKGEEEEKHNLEKKNKKLKEIKEHMLNSIKEKEDKKLKEKQEDLNYLEEFKKKLAFLETEDKNEMMDRRRREKDLADYRRLQTEEKRRVAMKDFEQFNEDYYKQVKRLEMEDDDFIKYAEEWIREYKKQGKNITPLLLELKRYKKNYSLA